MNFLYGAALAACSMFYIFSNIFSEQSNNKGLENENKTYKTDENSTANPARTSDKKLENATLEDIYEAAAAFMSVEDLFVMGQVALVVNTAQIQALKDKSKPYPFYKRWFLILQDRNGCKNPVEGDESFKTLIFDSVYPVNVHCAEIMQVYDIEKHKAAFKKAYKGICFLFPEIMLYNENDDSLKAFIDIFFFRYL
jgi:hypothetical protein